jgi:Aerotolerance regulator N-terminal/von Willebrand factor type A domain
MSFLAPFFLLGALAVAAPVLFHLIRHTTRERTVFSSVMFLPSSRPRLTRRSRLEHLLLLLLRCLALALLALGFARPFLRKNAFIAGSGAGTRRVVVLVDASASMRRTGLWAAAQDRAASILRGVAPGDEAAVFLFSRQVRPLISFEEWKAAPAGTRAALAVSRLAAASPGWEDDHLGDALIRAAETLAESDGEKKADGPRQIFLISDLKAGSRLDALQAYDWPKAIQLIVEALPARHPTNAGLQLVADAPDADQQAAPALRVRVRNAANSAREQFQVGWAGPGGAFLAPAVDVYVPPGQSRVVAVPTLPHAADMREVVLRGDDEDFDNTAYVAASEKQRWSVVYFGTEAAGDTHAPLFFLQRALPNNPHLTVQLSAFAPTAAVAPATLAEAKLVVVTTALADGTAAALRAQLLAGGTLLYAPPNPTGAATLAELLGLGAVPLEEVQPSDYAMFGDINFQHPVFAPFADPHYSDFTKIHIWKYRRLKESGIPGARVLARFDGGDPALVEVPVGQGRLLVLLTGWNPGDSQLAVSSKFVPLIQSILELAGGPADQAWQYFVGDPIPLGGGQGSTVRRPDGTAVVLPAGTASFGDTLVPGVYGIESGGRSWRVAVNVAATESRTEPLATDELERYGAPGSKTAPEIAQAAQREALLQAAEAESRQKLWRWLLGATLAVLLVESVVAGWTTRRGETTVEPVKTVA